MSTPAHWELILKWNKNAISLSSPLPTKYDLYVALYGYFLLLPSRKGPGLSAWLLCSMIESERNTKKKENKSSEKMRTGGILQKEKKIWKKRKTAATVCGGS